MVIGEGPKDSVETVDMKRSLEVGRRVGPHEFELPKIPDDAAARLAAERAVSEQSAVEGYSFEASSMGMD